MNKIELITKYSEDAFDEVYRADSRIGILDGNTRDMVFVGAKTVKIPKWNAGGMYDYKRANAAVAGDFSGFTAGSGSGNGYGYQQSDMGYEWETFTLAVDRAVQYRVDMFDDEETAKTLVARGSTQVNKQVLIPEIDAYSFSKIAGAASASLGNLENSATIGDGAGEVSALEALNAGLLWGEENEVDAENQVIFCSPRFLQALRNTSKNGLVKPLLQGEFEKNVRFTIEEYEGRKIISVPPKRFFTDIVLGAGLYHKSATSKDIDFMIVDKNAIYHIVKYNKIKVFGPDVVQDYDGYKINVHVYHDVFIPDNKKVGIYVKTGGFAAQSGDYASVVIGSQTAGTAQYDANFLGLGVLPGSVMVDEYVISGTAGLPGAAKSSLTTPTTIWNGTTVLGVDIDVHTTSGLSNGSDGYVFAIKSGIVVAVKKITVVAHA